MQKNNLENVYRPLDFIGIGAAKSGTTSLFHYLRYHPQIYLPLEKEVPFFSDEKRLACGWESFTQEFFSKAPWDARWGKITPQYMGDSRMPQRIFDYMPQVKLIALLRNPIDRAFSYYRMKIWANEEHRSFEEIVADQVREEVLEKSRQLSLSGTETYLIRGEYGRILKGFIQYFPQEQLLILFTDDLEKRPQIVLDSICAFLGLPSGFSPPNIGKKYYVGGNRKRFPWLVPIAQNILPVKWLWHILPKNNRRFLFLWFHQEINQTHKDSPLLSPNLRTKLMNFYRPDVKELENLIGKKVPWQDFSSL